MNKPILIEIIACLVLGTILGVAFWLFDGGKTQKKVSKCPGGVSNAQKADSSDGIRIVNSTGKPVKPVELQIINLAKIRPIKIYAGKWRKEGYLEVIGK